jgi:uncharacterized protein (DUF885 family)
MTRTLSALACLLTLTTVLAPAQSRSVDAFFDSFTGDWVRGNPNLATSTRFFDGDEQRQLERQLTPATPAYREARVQLARRGLAGLATFDRGAMTAEQRLSAEIMEWLLDTVVRGDRFNDYYFPFEQFGGVNVGLVNALTVGHPLASESDADTYLARLRQVAARMDESIAEAARLADRGLIPPRFILQATIAQMRQFVAGPPAGNPLVTVFAERMGAANVAAGRRAALEADAESIVASQVYPAWQRTLALLETLVAGASDNAGLWRFPDGAAAYADALRRFTTTSLSADAIHEIGLREVARLEHSIEAILAKLGRVSGTLNARIAQLRLDLAYPSTDEGRTRIMADVERFMRDAERRAALQFDRRPKSQVVAQPFPRFREANAAASYSSPSSDGSRPGTFQIPLRPERLTAFGLRTLVYHETVPGHHFQIALELENDAVPRFRRIRALGGISVASEGWALYAERLAAESGWYEDDLEGLLGQLDAELFRARRLVVDTGIHAKRWTREQAIAYGIEASEVERYVVNPGQACAYMLGQLKIIELRDRARAALDGRFSIREFHDVVLGTGTAPLDVLERQVDGYIRSRR